MEAGIAIASDPFSANAWYDHRWMEHLDLRVRAMVDFWRYNLLLKGLCARLMRDLLSKIHSSQAHGHSQ